MTFSELQQHYQSLTKQFICSQTTIATMESCTSGFLASLLTDTEGASAVFKGSFVTYCNEAKTDCGVPEELIRSFGVYSKETAVSMAQTCRERFHADLGIGVTGTFGNTDPNNSDSVSGMVYYAFASRDKVTCFCLEIPVQNSRFEYKCAVAAEVLSHFPDLDKAGST